MAPTPTISQVISSNEQLAQESNLSRPVAVFLGGTSGIGAATAKALAEVFKGNVHLILSSRSRQSAQNVIESLPFPTTTSTTTANLSLSTSTSTPKAPSDNSTTVVDFIQSDATDVKSMKSLAQEIKELGVEKINFLVLSCGQLTLDGSDRTKDGVEKKLAMNFYSRFALAYHLLPLLRAASCMNEPAKVMSILAPSRGGKIDVKDFGLSKESKRIGQSILHRGQWLRAAEKAGVTYNDLMTEGFSKMKEISSSSSFSSSYEDDDDEVEISFIHSFPGFVNTSMLKNFHWPIRLLFAPLIWLGENQDNSGRFMLNVLLRKDTAKGCHFTGPEGQKLDPGTAPAVWHGAEVGSLARDEIIKNLFIHLKDVAGLD